MKINLKNAISTFYPNPSYEQIYFEAVANALDAKATEIVIKIKIDAFDRPETLQIVIKDNGIGFIDENFEKFSQLLEVDGIDHKGLGRLVYLAYFNNVKIESFYGSSKKRIFTFNSKFTGKADMLEERGSGSSLFFDGYCKDRIYKYGYLIPHKIKESLIQEFFPLFFNKKEKGKSLNIKIELEVEHPNPNNEFYSSQSVFNLSDLPQLHKVTFEAESTDIFRNLEIHYSVENKVEKNKSIYTAVCVDNRALEFDLVPIEAIPNGYQLRFLFVSDYFQGKVNTSRQKLLLPDELTEKALKEKLREEIGNIIICNIPTVKENNQRVTEKLNEHFPHLTGYFPKPSAGLILKTAVLEVAQNKFFSDQRKILECENLDDEQYEKAIELSSRSLAEYVMYRSLIIQKLKSMTSKNHEREIHQLIVPMQQTLQKEEFDDDIYNNNVWLLDDRFMTYHTILSDETMQNVIQSIALDNVEDNSRPDITIVFSGNPTTDLLDVKQLNPFIIDLFVMTYDSFINDAESRNAAFLRVLKSTIRKSIESTNSISQIVTNPVSHIEIDSQPVCNNSLNDL